MPTSSTTSVPVDRPCPVCGHNRGRPLHVQTFALVDGHPMADGYAVVACVACGMVYADVGTTQARMDAFYAEQSKYADARTSTGAGESAADRGRLDGLADQIATRLPDRATRIADVGCAGGGLLRALRRLGYRDLVGIDPAPACVDMTAALGIAAHVGTLTALPAAVRDCDCVVLSHVLEHVLDCRAAMHALAPVLKPDGRVWAEVPDATQYARDLAAPFQEFNTEHVNHFSPRALANLMAGYGYAAEHVYAVLLAACVPYPAIGGMYRRGPDAGPVVPDPTLAEAVAGYVAASAALMDEIDRRLRRALSRSRRVIVWGTGQLTMKLLRQTALADADVVAFVDGNPVNWGKRLRGVAILPPAEAATLPDPVLVASTLHQDEIAADIRGKYAMRNPLILLRGPTEVE